MANFKEDLVKIKAFVFDIDGVLSLQTINLNTFGVPNRTVNLRDGYALQLAVKKGYHVGVISGSSSKEYLISGTGSILEPVEMSICSGFPARNWKKEIRLSRNWTL